MRQNMKLLDELLQLLNEMKFQDATKLDAIKRKTELYIKKIFGIDSKYTKDINSINFYSFVYPCSNETEVIMWNEGTQQFVNIINTMKDELLLFQEDTPIAGYSSNHVSSPALGTKKGPPSIGEKVFIVHGHDEEMKQSVARWLEQLDLEPIILHERPNRGRHILKKLQDESDEAVFAIVLLSGDDKCIDNENPEQIKTRARQNVILELGYFIAKLGNENVLALYNQDSNFEKPGDYDGIVYTKYDSVGSWRLELGQELKNSGLNIDLNKLMK